jgi:hypothetical protein
MRALAAVLVCAVMISSGSMSAAAPPEHRKKAARVKTPAPKPAPVFRWRPADPSFDQHGRPYRPPPGLPCPIDLGYGRWTSCMYR